jgi:hypothetical protein
LKEPFKDIRNAGEKQMPGIVKRAEMNPAGMIIKVRKITESPDFPFMQNGVKCRAIRDKENKAF